MQINYKHYQHPFTLLPSRAVCLEKPEENTPPVEAEVVPDSSAELADLSKAVAEGVEAQKEEERRAEVQKSKAEREKILKTDEKQDEVQGDERAEEKESIPLSSVITKAFRNPNAEELFGTKSAKEWVVKMNQLNRRPLEPASIDFLCQLVASELLKSPENFIDWMTKSSLLQTYPAAGITIETLLILKNEVGLADVTAINSFDLIPYQKVIQHQNYQALKRETGTTHKMIWDIIKATSSLRVMVVQENADRFIGTFLGDPALPFVIDLVKTHPQSSLQDLLAIGRTAYFSGETLPLSKEATAHARRDIEFMRSFFGEMKLLKDRPVVINASNELAKSGQEDGYVGLYFGNKNLRQNMASSSGELTTHMLVTPEITTHLQQTEALQEQEHEQMQLAATKEQLMENISNSLVQSPPGTTFLFWGHGNEQLFGAAKKLRISSIELAGMILKRYQKWPPPQNGVDVFIFGACQASSYIRNISEELKSKNVSAIAIAQSEYGNASVGYNTHSKKYDAKNVAIGDSLSTLFESGNLNQLSINKLLEFQNSQHERGEIRNNYSIFFLGKTGLLQFGMNDGQPQTPADEFEEEQNI